MQEMSIMEEELGMKDDPDGDASKISLIQSVTHSLGRSLSLNQTLVTHPNSDTN